MVKQNHVSRRHSTPTFRAFCPVLSFILNCDYSDVHLSLPSLSTTVDSRTVQMHVRFEVFTAASMEVTAFCDTATCSLVQLHRRFRGEYCFCHHPHYGGSTNLWNVGLLQRHHTALYRWRLSSSVKTQLQAYSFRNFHGHEVLSVAMSRRCTKWRFIGRPSFPRLLFFLQQLRQLHNFGKRSLMLLTVFWSRSALAWGAVRCNCLHTLPCAFRSVAATVRHALRYKEAYFGKTVYWWCTLHLTDLKLDVWQY
jgi:hypothetical protein